MGLCINARLVMPSKALITDNCLVTNNNTKGLFLILQTFAETIAKFGIHLFGFLLCIAVFIHKHYSDYKYLH